MKKITKVTFYQMIDENKESSGRHLRPIDPLKEGIYSLVTKIKTTVPIEESRELGTYTRHRLVWK